MGRVLLAQVISDLLKPEKTNLHIREDRKRGIYVDGLSEWVVRTPEQVRPHLLPRDFTGVHAAVDRLFAGASTIVQDLREKGPENFKDFLSISFCGPPSTGRTRRLVEA